MGDRLAPIPYFEQSAIALEQTASTTRSHPNNLSNLIETSLEPAVSKAESLSATPLWLASKDE